MADRLSNFLIFSLLLGGFCAVWATTALITYWDTSRRGLPGSEKGLWTALAVLVPGIGFLAYLAARLMGLSFSGAGQEIPVNEQVRRRWTMVKPQPQVEARGHTIPAAELLHSGADSGAAGYSSTQPAPGPAQPGVAQTARPAPAPQPVYRLEVMDGPHAGKSFLLAELPLKIGRGHEAGLRLDDDLNVSRQHAEIYRQAGVVRIRDLHSTHGTEVNGYSIDDKALDLGDRVRVGGTVLLVGLKEGQ